MNGTYVWSLGIALAFVVGCIVDRDSPCGEHQVKTRGEFLGCVCAPGHAWSADGKDCVPCAEHEVVEDGACVCAEGFGRAQAGAACKAIEEAGSEDAGGPMD